MLNARITPSSGPDACPPGDGNLADGISAAAESTAVRADPISAAAGGAAAGAVVGSMLLPIFGSLVGSLIGAVAAGAFASSRHD